MHIQCTAEHPSSSFIWMSFVLCGSLFILTSFGSFRIYTTHPFHSFLNLGSSSSFSWAFKNMFPTPIHHPPRSLQKPKHLSKNQTIASIADNMYLHYHMFFIVFLLVAVLSVTSNADLESQLQKRQIIAQKRQSMHEIWQSMVLVSFR